MITLHELNPNNYPTTDEQSANLQLLLTAMNVIRTTYGIAMTVDSGLRSTTDQQRINPSAPKSKHLLGLACDIADFDGSLWAWTFNNLDLMKQLNIYMEDPRWTHHPDNHGWCHYQVGAPNSGKRIFVPSSAPALNANFWDGIYDNATYDLT